MKQRRRRSIYLYIDALGDYYPNREYAQESKTVYDSSQNGIIALVFQLPLWRLIQELRRQKADNGIGTRELRLLLNDTAC